MKLRLTLFLAIALSLSPLAGFGPSCCSYFAWISNGDKQPDLPQQQHPVETRTSSWLCWFGLATCHVTMEEGNQKAASQEQQLHINAQRCASNWPRQRGCSERPRWIRYRVSKVITPKDPNQQSPSPKQKVLSLHDTLGHLWDNLEQRGVTWILTDVLKHLCILSLLSIAHGLWRRVRQLWGQETGPTASASIRTEHRGKDDINVSHLLRHIEAEIDLMERHLRTILLSHREARRSQQERQAVQDSGKKKNPSADSTPSTGQSAPSMDGQ